LNWGSRNTVKMGNENLVKKIGDFHKFLSNGFYMLATDNEEDIVYAVTFYNAAKKAYDNITNNVPHESLKGSLDGLAVILKDRGAKL